jgi:benzil reductase ((S)-benzoin forming)
MDDKSFKRLFIITGTSRGIGRALLQEALKQPEHLVVSLSREKPFVDRNHQNLTIDLNESRKIASVFDAIHFDATWLEAIETFALINNAGVLDPISPLIDCEDGLIEQSIRVNLIAPMILARHFYKFSKPFAGSKWIVNISSGAAYTPYDGWAPYGASKAGLDMITRTMAIEFSRIDTNFRVCSVAPGTVDTGMQEKIRNCTPNQFPQVAKFARLKEKGALFSPEWTAQTLIRCILNGQFENGKRYDLREMNTQP